MGIYDDYGKELPVYRVIYQRWLMNGFFNGWECHWHGQLENHGGETKQMAVNGKIVQLNKLPSGKLT